eukprot:scaffold385862_cov25-Prasinocladus_malaysianus.AAC.2
MIVGIMRVSARRRRAVVRAGECQFNLHPYELRMYQSVHSAVETIYVFIAAAATPVDIVSSRIITSDQLPYIKAARELRRRELITPIRKQTGQTAGLHILRRTKLVNRKRSYTHINFINTSFVVQGCRRGSQICWVTTCNCKSEIGYFVPYVFTPRKSLRLSLISGAAGGYEEPESGGQQSALPALVSLVATSRT